MLTKADCDNILLLPEELNRLRHFARNAPLLCSREDAKTLANYKLIQQHLVWKDGEQEDWDGSYEITDSGRRYLLFEKTERQEKRSTKALAISALILSALSIISQLVTALWIR